MQWHMFVGSCHPDYQELCQVPQEVGGEERDSSEQQKEAL